MKKSLAITTVSLLAFVASAAVVNAQYPPIQDVKPSKTAPSEVSYDRTPRTIDKAARRIVSTVPAGVVKTVVAYRGEAFLPVILGADAGQTFTVRIITPGGKIVILPSVSSTSKGTLLLPTVKISGDGVYTMNVTAVNGRVRTLNIRVAK
jgi:hypothetical protein